jgi:membrane protein YqaA with SNARE-associated domain
MMSRTLTAGLAQKVLLLLQQKKRSSLLRVFAHFGGLGLVPLGILDSSLVPTFGSLDVLTAWLAATHPDLWLYYGAMSTLGALIGSFITYRLGKTADQAWIERKFGAKRLRWARQLIEDYGFGSVFVSTVTPPPCPTSVFLLAAGMFRYPARRFYAAVFLGRSIRYFLITAIAAHYGKHIMRYFRPPQRYLLPSLIVTVVLAAVAIGIMVYRRRLRLESALPDQADPVAREVSAAK